MEYETYYDSAEGIIISRERARQELRRHGFTSEAQFEGAWVDLVAEIGDQSSYLATDVLTFLGY